MTSPAVNLTAYSSVELEFYFYSFSMENGEDFFVRYYNGSSYSTVATYAAGTSFTNNNFWVATVTLTSAQVNFASNARFRIQCDAGDNNDDIYIDAVTLTGFTGGLPEPGQSVTLVKPADRDRGLVGAAQDQDIVLLPNPVTDYLQIQYDGVIDEVRIISAQGTELRAYETDPDFREIHLKSIPAGVHVLLIRSGDAWIPKKFIKLD
jgi:hypothetical protein